MERHENWPNLAIIIGMIMIVCISGHFMLVRGAKGTEGHDQDPNAANKPIVMQEADAGQSDPKPVLPFHGKHDLSTAVGRKACTNGNTGCGDHYCLLYYIANQAWLLDHKVDALAVRQEELASTVSINSRALARHQLDGMHIPVESVPSQADRDMGQALMEGINAIDERLEWLDSALLESLDEQNASNERIEKLVASIEDAQAKPVYIELDELDGTSQGEPSRIAQSEGEQRLIGLANGVAVAVIVIIFLIVGCGFLLGKQKKETPIPAPPTQPPPPSEQSEAQSVVIDREDDALHNSSMDVEVLPVEEMVDLLRTLVEQGKLAAEAREQSNKEPAGLV